MKMRKFVKIFRVFMIIFNWLIKALRLSSEHSKSKKDDYEQKKENEENQG